MRSFYTDVLRKDRRFLSTARIADPNLLEPVFRAKVLAVLADLKRNGHAFMLYETFRSQARQESLWEQGVTQLRHVGVHGFGLAADIVRSVNGQPSWEGDFSPLWAAAKQHQIISGEDWGRPDKSHSFRDAPHVQRVAVQDQACLFAGVWYPDPKYDPYRDHPKIIRP